MNNPRQAVDLSRLIILLLDRFTPRQRDPIALHFGLFGPCLNVPTIAEELSCSHQNVSLTLHRAMVKLSPETVQDAGLQKLLEPFQADLLEVLNEAGGTLRMADLLDALGLSGTLLGVARLSFVTQFIPDVVFLPETSERHTAVTVLASSQFESCLDSLIDAVRRIGMPAPMTVLAQAAGIHDLREAEATVRISKLLGERDNLWGLRAWPTIRPLTLRDHIHLVLKQNGSPMHFTDICRVIREDRSLRHAEVSDGGIQNELVWDERFVKVGRGIYALREWGYAGGTLRGTIAEILREAKEPLGLDSIVERVQRRRHGATERTIKMVVNQCSKTMPQVQRLRPGIYIWYE
jgi:hypothetical protein